MNSEEIFREIQSVIEDICNISKSEIHMESSIMEDLDLSSLEIISVISKLQKVFSIRIAASEINEISDVSDLVSLIKEKIDL